MVDAAARALYTYDSDGLALLNEARRPARSALSGQVRGDLVLLYHFAGFMDAGQAAELALDYLLGGDEAPVVARFDVDRLVDYRAQRPLMTFSGDHWSSYDAPELTVRLAKDAIGTPFLIFSGPEPDTEWELFSRAVVSLVDELGVTLAVNFHGVPFGVPHTRPVHLIPHGNREDLLLGYPKWFDQAQVPGSAMALTEFRLAQAGRDVFGLAAQVPHYVARSAYPAAAVRILEAVTAATGLVLPAQELRERARRVAAQIDNEVGQGDQELRGVIQSLEEQYDAAEGAAGRPNLLAEQQQLPSADDLAREFEAFLAEQDGQSEG
ncbi:PAC2 family protein [Actinospica sp. MGRD01-02]|uniref:PAC2 family protein n=1 Tax=Actinospica acidithermotolerans TaxID=2828514 RepID=A0A941EER0_9ACTN|nr:PAC2 family protein [Actinospica acidithermotolerans]MBR7829343.1 PAC2 family protein [Actinospica acidithermotolerans]